MVIIQSLSFILFIIVKRALFLPSPAKVRASDLLSADFPSCNFSF